MCEIHTALLNPIYPSTSDTTSLVKPPSLVRNTNWALISTDIPSHCIRKMGEYMEARDFGASPIEDLQCGQTSLELLLTWSILLETYLGSPDISFSFKEQSTRSQYIRLSLSDGATVEELAGRIRDSLRHDPVPATNSDISPLKALLSVTESVNTTSAISSHREIEEAGPTDHFDLAIRCSIPDQGKEFSVTAFVNPSIFGTEQASRTTQQFIHILNQIRSPNAGGRRISEIERASSEDFRTIWSWNCNIPSPVHGTVLHAISRQVEQRPDAIAVLAWDGDLTYRELDELSSKLAARLLSSGISYGMILPLVFEKTMWTPVAILGVVKSGAAFSLLDEDLPLDRLRQLAQLISTRSAIALASVSQHSRASQLASEVIVVDSSLRDSEGIVPAIMPQPCPSDTCYVIFTSGTTGTPKAAIIQHHNICAFAELLAPKCGVTNDSRILALASYAFDVSMGNIFLSLLNGACLCIPSSWECKNDILGAIVRYHVSYAEMTPSVSRSLIPTELPALKVFNLLGEACTESVIARWRGTHIRVMNTYGPAECTVTTVVNDNVLGSIKPSVIGIGLGATWVMDLCDPKRLCPIGGVGELVIEGPQVGGGYLHNPEMTNAAFLQDPQWLVHGYAPGNNGRSGRLYRTGDLVRYVDGGHLEYLGRRDLQVKVRGQRIELGEVAAHKKLREMTEWSTCVVTLQNGAELLVVFIVAPRTATQTLSEMMTTVNAELLKSLPAAMVPSAWIPIDKIPLSMTGKTDYRMLKQIASALTLDNLIFPYKDPTDSTRRQTASEVELKLKALWAQVLNRDLESIGSSSNFFANGGESLAAIRLVSAAARERINLAVDTIFRHPQLADMARNCRLSTLIIEPPPDPFSIIKRPFATDLITDELAAKCATSADNIEDAYPTTPVQQGLIAASYRRPQAYVGRTILKLPAKVDRTRFVRAWENVAAVHPILRTRIVETASMGSLQVVLTDGNLSWHTSGDLAEHKNKDAKEAMGFGTPLCRWAIVTEPGSTYMLLTMHHALYDGWMLPRLGMEVFKAYQGVRLEPYMRFNLYVKHIKDIHSGPARDFWAQYLAEPSRSATFPRIPHSANDPRADAVFSKRFDKPDNANVGTSLATLFRAAWALLSAKLLGSNDVTFGATLSGRNVPLIGIDEMLGPAIATVPVRVRLNTEEVVGRYVERVQEEAVATMPFENVGLQRIRMFNEDTREGSRFQTLLIVHPPPSTRGPEDPDPAEISHEDGQLRSMLEGLDLSKDLRNFSEYGLMILVSQQHQGGLLVEASYDSRVLVASQVELLLEQFAHMTRQIGRAANRPRRLEDSDYASPHDINKVWSWNATPIECTNQCIHEVISRTAACHAQREAIYARDGSTTYGELDYLASVLAHRLTANGVGRSCVVPICMEKSRWTAVAMVGVLRTGAAFVLLDTVNLPKRRLQVIIDQTGATCIVTVGATQTFAKELLPAGITIVCDDLLHEPTHNHIAGPASGPNDTAFLVFTSGSTGIPKGISITHGNFMTAVHHHEKPLMMSKKTRVYDYASYSFDIAVHNALATLALGGCPCVPSEHDRQNDIEGSFERLRANWADLTPTVARLLNPLAVPSLTTLVLSGEPVGRDIIHQWSSKVQLINAYGPAECQICTVRNYLLHDEDASNIGLGVGCRTWIVDQHARSLAPVGAIGELVIEGPIVSPAYLATSLASGASWLHDPSWLSRGSEEINGRRGTVYRTGDQARYNPDGSIVFIGRASTQVKIKRPNQRRWVTTTMLLAIV